MLGSQTCHSKGPPISRWCTVRHLSNMIALLGEVAFLLPTMGATPQSSHAMMTAFGSRDTVALRPPCWEGAGALLWLFARQEYRQVGGRWCFAVFCYSCVFAMRGEIPKTCGARLPTMRCDTAKPCEARLSAFITCLTVRSK